jgi:hypothetical protein
MILGSLQTVILDVLGLSLVEVSRCLQHVIKLRYPYRLSAETGVGMSMFSSWPSRHHPRRGG